MATSEHFSADELSCSHCGRGADIVSARLLELVEQLRYNCGGYPLQCNCAYRCPEHNAEVGGVPNSQHVLGTAMDIQCPSQLTIGAGEPIVEVAIGVPCRFTPVLMLEGWSGWLIGGSP